MGNIFFACKFVFHCDDNDSMKTCIELQIQFIQSVLQIQRNLSIIIYISPSRKKMFHRMWNLNESLSSNSLKPNPSINHTIHSLSSPPNCQTQPSQMNLYNAKFKKNNTPIQIHYIVQYFHTTSTKKINKLIAIIEHNWNSHTVLGTRVPIYWALAHELHTHYMPIAARRLVADDLNTFWFLWNCRNVDSENSAVNHRERAISPGRSSESVVYFQNALFY